MLLTDYSGVLSFVTKGCLMDRSIDRGLDLIKAKLLRLRQLVMGKKTKQDIKRITPQEARNLTPAQMIILEVVLKKDANKKMVSGLNIVSAAIITMTAMAVITMRNKA